MIFKWLKRIFKKEQRVYAISDLHFSSVVNKPMDVFGGSWTGYENKIEKNWQKMISKNDIVLVAGDLSWGMTLEEAKPDLQKIGKFNGIKVFIKGNHEYWWKSISKVREILDPSEIALQNDSVEIGKYLICGTRGWTVKEKTKEQSPEDKKIFDREVERLKLTLNDMSKKRKSFHKVICMMHYPPTNSSLDDSEFTKLFEEYHVDAVVFGHLHGKKIRKSTEYVKNGIRYYLTSCDQIDNIPARVF